MSKKANLKTLFFVSALVTFLLTMSVPAMAADAPVANDDSATVAEGGTVTVVNGTDTSVLDNDTDTDADPLTAYLDTDVINGTLTLNSDGTFSYTHDGSETTSDSFTYHANDGTSDSILAATVNITITSENDPPVANDDSASTDEDTPVNINVLANDSDVDVGDILIVISVSDPANGTAVIEVDNTVTYTPDADYNGPDSFTYTISDGNEGSDTATVSITVNPVNDPPVAEIAGIADDIITIHLRIKVTPQTLNLERSGKWVKVHIHDDSKNTPQLMDITLDGSGSYDPEGDPLTYDWTLIGPDGDIPVADDVVSQVKALSAGSYTVTLVVNDGTVDSTLASEEFTLTNMTVSDLAAVNPADFTLNGVPAVEVKGGGNSIAISFEDDAIAATVDVGLDVAMELLGPVSGVDYIDVIQDKAGGSGKGKSELKSEVTTLSQNEEPEDSADDKANGKDNAPGQNKESEGNDSIDIAPGQNNNQGNNTNGKETGKDNAPGQNKKLEVNVSGTSKGKESAPGQNK